VVLRWHNHSPEIMSIVVKFSHSLWVSYFGLGQNRIWITRVLDILLTASAKGQYSPINSISAKLLILISNQGQSFFSYFFNF
jgi:hypothetical protein